LHSGSQTAYICDGCHTSDNPNQAVMTLPTNQRLILISGGSIFLAPRISLPMSATSLNPEELRFRPGQEFYWKVEIVSYNQSQGLVKLKVLDYYADDSAGFLNQQLKHPVKQIEFELLDWKQLEPQLYFYHYNNILVLLEESKAGETKYTKPAKEKTPSDDHIPLGTLAVEAPYQISGIVEKREPVKETISESFTIYFDEAAFGTGCVHVSKSFKWYWEPILFTIENSEIIPEYDLVKSFFPKAFGGRKKFDVNAMIDLLDGKVSRTIATSPQIARINDLLIEGMKNARVQKFINLPKVKTDKSLFTADEFFDYPDDKNRDGNIFKQTELDILMASLGKQELRNRKQIEYLAGAKQSPEHKIRFTLKPNFGFVFMVEGESMNHFCWELLNSHATYLWSFSKAGSHAEQQYARVERHITTIRETGREYYKSTYHHLPPEPDMLFSVIYHKNAGSDLVDGFPGWKHRFQERLV
jgi:hypothetical protein